MSPALPREAAHGFTSTPAMGCEKRWPHRPRPGTQTQPRHNNSYTPQIDQTEGSPVVTDFYKKATGRDAAQVKATWSRIVFSGKGMAPKQLADSAALKKAVAADPKGVGYLESHGKNPTTRHANCLACTTSTVDS